MISYTILTQEQYARLIEQNQQCQHDKASVEKDSISMKQQIKMLKNWLKMLRDQFKTEKTQKIHLLSHLRLQAMKLNQVYKKLSLSAEIITTLESQKAQALESMQKLKQEKTQLKQENQMLLKELISLREQKRKKQAQNLNFPQNQPSSKTEITQLNNRLIQAKQQNQKLKQQIEKNIQELNQKNHIILKKCQSQQKITKELQHYKNQNIKIYEELQKYKLSPIPKLQEMLKAKETWIQQLTKTVNQLKQKCIELEMMTSPQNQRIQNQHLVINPNHKQPFFNNNQANGNQQAYQPNPILSSPIFSVQPPTLTQFQRQRQQELERMKYLTICRQLAKQFTSKLAKMQHEKKSIEQKYQSIRLKLNEYQYNEFRYKDKINLYVQKIERFEKFTQRQQQEMERLIEQFDEELNNMLKKKQDEVKIKFQQEVQKYQTQMQKKHQQKQKQKQMILKRAISAPQYIDDQFLKEAKNLTQEIPLELQMIKMELQQVKIELNQKIQQIEQLKVQNESLKSENSKIKKQQSKIKASKQNYKQKYLQIEEQCYQKCTEIRRYKNIVQQLCQQLEIKTNEIQILKKQLIKQLHNSVSSNLNSPNVNNNQEENSLNLSAKFSSEKIKQSLKRENSEYLQYQVSEIDTQGQKKNQTVLNNIIIGKLGTYKNIFKNVQQNHSNLTAPGLPTKNSQISDRQNKSKHKISNLDSLRNPAVNESMDSIKNSFMNSSFTSNESICQNTQSSPNKSSASSFQSYGIKQLYSQKQNQNKRAFLIHKNSLK